MSEAKFAVATDVRRDRGTAGAWFSLALAIALLNVGNIALDTAVKGRPISLDLFLSLAFPIAIFCLGVAFYFYVRALAILPLGVAYPVMVGVTLLVVTGLDKSHSLTQIAGVIAVFAGVTLVSRSPRPARKG